MDRSPTKKEYKITIKTIILVAIIFILCLLATGFIVHHSISCKNISAEKSTTENTSIKDNIESVYLPKVKKYIDLRLPTSIIPLIYKIEIIPFIIEKNFTFNGNVNIIVKCIENTKNISLHSNTLKIKDEDVSVKLNENSASFLSIKKMFFIEEKQFFVIEFENELIKDNLYQINIKYSGELNDQLKGFYRSSYKVGNETRWLAATQFQPTDARMAFPCFDEPGLKAKFKLAIARPKNMTSISNMPKEGISVPVNGLPSYVWDVYQESVPMSTYLFAFVVSDFAHRTSGNFTIWSRMDQIESADYALEVGPKIMKYMENFFDIDYPLPKMDMIALPDFSAGAMENWGLITFSEMSMLYNPNVSAINYKQNVAIIMSHEIAHQWFGNLVTPKWWSDLWLNEGFASYMQYLGVDAVEPSWKLMDHFIIDQVHSVFTADSGSSTHPISVHEIHDPNEISELFDLISYKKGSTIIRMMDHFLTKQVFRNGLKKYLKELAYRSAEQDDLWEFLTREAHLNHIFDDSMNVKEIMDTWTLQAGYPVVTVTRNYNDKTVHLEQTMFMLSESKEKSEITNDSLWYIPISYTTSSQLNFNNTQPSYWMRNTKEFSIIDIALPKDNWILLNIQQTGYYRVNYDNENWQLIIKHLRNPKTFEDISSPNRAQLINDAFNLARAGYLNYDIALDVTRYLENETDYVPWVAALSGLSFINNMLKKEGKYYKFREYFIKLIEKIYNEVGFEDKFSDDMLKVFKRQATVSYACALGYRSCIDNCIKQYHAWMKEPNPEINNPISPNMRMLVYCTAIKYGDALEWDWAWDRYFNTTIPSEKGTLMMTLGCTRERWILTRFLDRAMSEKYGLKKADAFTVLAIVGNSLTGQPIAYNYLKTHWDTVKAYLGTSQSKIQELLVVPLDDNFNKNQLNEYKKFVDERIDDRGRYLNAAIQNVEEKIKWSDKHYKTIVNWLDKISNE